VFVLVIIELVGEPVPFDATQFDVIKRLAHARLYEQYATAGSGHGHFEMRRRRSGVLFRRFHRRAKKTGTTRE